MYIRPGPWGKMFPLFLPLSGSASNGAVPQMRSPAPGFATTAMLLRYRRPPEGRKAQIQKENSQVRDPKAAADKPPPPQAVEKPTFKKETTFKIIKIRTCA